MTPRATPSQAPPAAEAAARSTSRRPRRAGAGAVTGAGVSWPVRRDDFFPYADCAHCYWAGYFSSRPASKGYVRQATAYLAAARQLQALAPIDARGGSAPPGPRLDALEAAVSLTQHHDAITGTAKQAVANDYVRCV